jgi:predicted MFS family arabinose efflux permease
MGFAPVITKISADLSLSYTEAGSLQTFLFIPVTLVQVPVGILVDKYSRRGFLISIMIGLMVSSALFAFSQNKLEAFILRGAMGVTTGALFVPVVRLILNFCNRSERAFAVGVLGAVQGLGFFVAAVSPVPLASFFGGWRGSLLVLDSLPLVALLLLFLLPGEVFALGPPQALAAHAKEIIKMPATWILAYDQFVRLGLVAMISTWVPAFLYQARGFSEVDSGIVLGSTWVAAVFATLIAGYVSDKRNSSLAVIEISLLVSAPFFVMMTTAYDHAALVAFSIGAGALMYSSISPMFSVLPTIYGERGMGLVAGIENTMATAGAAVMPLVMGYLRDITASFDVGWLLAAGLAASGGLVSLYLSRYGGTRSRPGS